MYIRLGTLALIVGMWAWFGYNANAYLGEFGTPTTPQPIQQNQRFSAYDVQIHSRDNFTQWDAPMDAQHGTDCAAPPATHPVSALSESVFICNDHVMTAGNAAGYGEIVLTPSQLLDCTVVCSVTFDLSTQRLSSRDWPDLWLTPWADNLALPFDLGDVDLQGPPRQGIHVNAEASQNSWAVSTISNYSETALPNAWWVGMGDGIDPSVNQAAVRQTFKLTITTGHVRFERMPSTTAPGFVWVDANAPVLQASDYVVQFAHHIYNPTKDGAGVPATWHWSGFALNPAVPFTLIHATISGGTVTFNAPAPANAYLRFSGVCKVLIDGVLAPKMTFIGHFEHASNYFVPIAQGKTSVNVTFATDDWYGGPCGAQDFAVWAKGSSPFASPTPTPSCTSTAKILDMSNRLQMRGVDARWVETKVVNFEPFWYGSDEFLIGEPMSLNVDAGRFGNPKSSVAATSASGPQPASLRFFDLRPETFTGGTVRHANPINPMKWWQNDRGITVGSPTRVMGAAPTSFTAGSWATINGANGRLAVEHDRWVSMFPHADVVLTAQSQRHGRVQTIEKATLLRHREPILSGVMQRDVPASPLLSILQESAPCTPTPFPPTATSTSTPAPFTPTPSATSTSTPSPTATSVQPTATRTPSPTGTPLLPKAVCTIRWGNNTLVNLGQLTQAECAARGN